MAQAMLWPTEESLSKHLRLCHGMTGSQTDRLSMEGQARLHEQAHEKGSSAGTNPHTHRKKEAAE